MTTTDIKIVRNIKGIIPKDKQPGYQRKTNNTGCGKMG